MEQKFKDTLQAIIHGTKAYKLEWTYLSDKHYDLVEQFYTQQIETEDGMMYMTFDSAFDARFNELFLSIVCTDITDEDETNVGEYYELRVFKLEEKDGLEFETPILIYQSTDAVYLEDLKNLYTYAAANASGVDRIMDQLIAELGE